MVTDNLYDILHDFHGVEARERMGFKPWPEPYSFPLSQRVQLEDEDLFIKECILTGYQLLSRRRRQDFILQENDSGCAIYYRLVDGYFEAAII